MTRTDVNEENELRARSYLYVPGDQPERLAGAHTRGADVLIVDLEDAVPASRKEEARRVVVDWLSQYSAPVPVWVRVNPGEAGDADLRAIGARPEVAGICLAKAESRASVEAVARALDAAGSRAVLAPILETAVAVLNARDIASAARVVRLQIGEADLRAELGIEPSPDEHEMLWVRSQVVLASAAAGIDAPLAPAATDFRDLDALRTSTDALRRLGFSGRSCIHPAQVVVVNEVFTVGEAEFDAARTVLSLDEASGGAVTSDGAGHMIDEAVVRRARRLLG